MGPREDGRSGGATTDFRWSSSESDCSVGSGSSIICVERVNCSERDCSYLLSPDEDDELESLVCQCECPDGSL